MESIRQYRIVRELGAGGMGVVYLAEDTTLKRKVALKVVAPGLHHDPVARERLIREAQSAAAIDHDNVAAIYEVGEENGVAFIAMQYVDGETLSQRLARGPLPVADAVDAAIWIADALAEAHRLSIIHRDLKPHNVMLTVRGQVKVLDFGLAKSLATLVPGEDEPTRREITRRGEVVGTLVYMSPEQLHGDDLDARSDIFAFGMLLYELLSQQRPFDGATTVEVIANILTAKPAPLTGIPRPLATLVMKCLEKRPEDRYQGMSEVVAELKSIRASLDDSGAKTARVKARTKRRSKTIDSIAVLPFENAGADDYLADGIADLITMQLSRLPKLRVMSRSTASSYRGKTIDVRRIGDELNVRAIMTGTVRAHSDSLRVAVELADTADGALIWAETYDRPMQDVPALQNEIAATIAERFRAPLSGSDRRRATPAVHDPDPEAYRLYLQGRFWWGKRPGEGYLKAIDYFQQAIDRDPLYALAYSGLADALATLGSWESGVRRPHDVMPAARSAAKRALDLDDRLAEAHASFGYVAFHYDRDWPLARREFARAVELNPNCVNALHWSSHLFVAGLEVERSAAMSRDVLAVDPLDLICNVHLAWHHWMARDAAAGLEACRRYAEVDSRSMWMPFFEGVLQCLDGNWPDAIGRLEAARRIAPSVSFSLAALAYAHGMAGHRETAEQALGELRALSAAHYVTAYDFAMAHIGLGQADEAFERLGAAVEERSSWMVYLDAEPRLDPIRSDARFAALRERVGLPVSL